MILSGQSIQNLNIMRPFIGRTRYKGMTFGCGSAGYDVRVEFQDTQKQIYLGPGDFILGSTMDKFNMPLDVLGIVHDKSTWARRGLAVQNTVIEPGWRGFLTLELTNHGPVGLTIEAGMPIAQIVFHWVDKPTTGYEGKYQDQRRRPVEAILEDN